MNLPIIINNKTEVLKYLEIFSSEILPNYEKMRNFDFGENSKNYVSRLSPVIVRKIITEEMITKYILKIHSFKKIEKFLHELFWRSYWKGFLEHHPIIYLSYYRDLERLSMQKKTVKYKRAIMGETNILCFDHWMKELISSGYLHNHSRMWFASIWIFTLELPWQLGAELFMTNLFDADFASNTLSWRWVAGLHTKGKHYIAFPENIKKYTGGKFYPKDQLNTRPLPLLAEDDLELVPFKLIESKKIKKISCLLIHENDLSLDTDLEFDFIIIQKSPNNNQIRSQHVFNYILSCLNETYLSVKRKYPSKVITFDWLEEENLSKILIKNNIKNIYLKYPYQNLLKYQLESFLKKCSVDFYYTYTNWDKLVLPHCSKGFFKLKKEIPSIIKKVI